MILINESNTGRVALFLPGAWAWAEEYKKESAVYQMAQTVTGAVDKVYIAKGSEITLKEQGQIAIDFINKTEKNSPDTEVVLVGHSTGCRVIHELLRQTASTVKAINISPVTNTGTVPSALNAVINDKGYRLDSLKALMKYRLIHPEALVENDDLAMHSLVSGEVHSIEDFNKLGIRERELPKNLRSLFIPKYSTKHLGHDIHNIAPIDDNLFSIISQYLNAKANGAEFYTIPGGHYPILRGKEPLEKIIKQIGKQWNEQAAES